MLYNLIMKWRCGCGVGLKFNFFMGLAGIFLSAPFLIVIYLSFASKNNYSIWKIPLIYR